MCPQAGLNLLPLKTSRGLACPALAPPIFLLIRFGKSTLSAIVCRIKVALYRLYVISCAHVHNTFPLCPAGQAKEGIVHGHVHLAVGVPVQQKATTAFGTKITLAREHAIGIRIPAFSSIPGPKTHVSP